MNAHTKRYVHDLNSPRHPETAVYAQDLKVAKAQVLRDALATRPAGWSGEWMDHPTRGTWMLRLFNSRNKVVPQATVILQYRPLRRVANY